MHPRQYSNVGMGSEKLLQSKALRWNMKRQNYPKIYALLTFSVKVARWCGVGVGLESAAFAGVGFRVDEYVFGGVGVAVDKVWPDSDSD